MTRRTVALTVLAASLLASASGLTAHDKVSIRVTPSISRAPAFVRVIARIERDPGNRTLEITADSGEFYRSSRINLEGADAPSVTELALKNLPGGEYQISAVLVDNLGRRSIAQRSVIVMKMIGEP